MSANLVYLYNNILFVPATVVFLIIHILRLFTNHLDSMETKGVIN